MERRPRAWQYAALWARNNTQLNTDQIKHHVHAEMFKEPGRAVENAPSCAAEQQPQRTKYDRPENNQKEIIRGDVLAEEIETPALVWKWFASPVEPTLEALFEKYWKWCSTHKDNWCIVPQ